MKREGFQHGAVRVNRNKLLRIAGGEAAPEQLGGVAYARAPSRDTGKCRRPRCHQHPATKARDKAKGARKLRADDVELNHRLVSWRVVDGAPGVGASGVKDYKGASASAVLAHLAGSISWHQDDDDDDDQDGATDLETAPPGLSDLYDLIVGLQAQAGAPAPYGQEDADDGAVAGGDEIQELQEQDTDVEGEMGFCMVGITIALEFSDGEEDWIVVEEIPSA